ncbi:ribonuclease III [Synechococcus elongatus]|uniref:ribonuclease III n=1 Tax=Synechococcus elongatus TaxID=32046 RepID=UPI003CC8447E
MTASSAQPAIALEPQRLKQLQRLLAKLPLAITPDLDWQQIDRALTHPSAAEDHYDRLEFLGDAVLRLAIADFLDRHYPNLSVGDCSALRSELGSDRTLAAIAASYGLERVLRVGKTAVNDHAGQQSRLAEAFEALLGALYLSQRTLDPIRPWLDPLLQQRATAMLQDPTRGNYKAALQEWTLQRYQELPEYRTEQRSDACGDPEAFAAEVWFRGEKLGSGVGRSIKAAQQAAAQVACTALALTHAER